MVPWHEIVPAEEREQIFKKYGLTADRLPQLVRDDAIVQEIGAQPGDLIRIFRKSPTAGETVYYRVVE